MRRRLRLGLCFRTALVATLLISLAACTQNPTPVPDPTAAPTSSTSSTATPTPVPTPTVPAKWPPANLDPSVKATQKVIFSNPWSKNESKIFAIGESLMDIIRKTPKGATLTLSTYNITFPKSAIELIAAHKRGVNIHIILSTELTKDIQHDRLKAALGTNMKKRSYVVTRDKSIRLHSKFLLVSKSGKLKNIVWVSSGNFTWAAGGYQANDALTTVGDKALYNFIMEQFDLMRTGVTDPAKLARTTTTSTAFVQTFPLPAGGPANDPVEQLLRDVTCVKGKNTTIVRLAHYIFTKERRYLVDTIRSLKEQGCELRVVGDTHEWGEAVLGGLIAKGPGKIKVLSVQGTDLHTKITSINGWDAAGNRIQVAMVGSHNLSGRALTNSDAGVNDEIAFTIWNPKIIKKYDAWVDSVMKNHTNPYKAE